MSRRRWTWVALGAALLAAVLVVGPPADEGDPLDPRGTGPLGTKALVLLLERMGAEVDITRAAPTADVDVVLVLADDLSERRRDDVRDWVRDGGTLVVTDPSSPLTPFDVQAPATFGPVAATLDRRCEVAALADIDRVDPAGGVLYDVGDQRGCFRRSGGAFVGIAAAGDGTVAAVGGAAAFVNDVIGGSGNARLAAALLAPSPGTRVAVLQPPRPGGGGKSLWDLVAPNVKQALLQLGVAFLVYALWRARRHGRPVLERQPVDLPGSELVVAVGNLLQQARRRDQAAALLRDDLRRDLAVRLGLGPSATAEAVAEVAAARTGIPSDRLLQALVPSPIAGDAELVAVAQSTEAVRQEVTHAR